ncbi:MAG: Kef-type transport system, putative NAD-binding component [Firmicutes bacterium]|nr:Kef-type transport system, putative NAD-binding component [Bacillota bacterium]
MSKLTGTFSEKMYKIIFESDTPQGRAFDIVVIISIVSSSLLVMAESVSPVYSEYGQQLDMFTWFFVILFTLEYLLRVGYSKNRRKYVVSFFGIIDLAAILPAYLSLIIPSVHLLVVIRLFRLLRLFTILKMGRYVKESGTIIMALKASRPKITVFIFAILFIITIVGTMMYIVEGPREGFSSIPEAMYWATVTVATVGYGDITPKTPLGRLIASMLILVGYGIIAVPTGIITNEISTVTKESKGSIICSSCGHSIPMKDNTFYCSKCGEKLNR